MISIETNMLEKEMLLGMSKEMKLGLLDDANKTGEYTIVRQIMKILLDAPISEGGISSDEIQEVLDMKKQYGRFK
jgi:hydrogenase maturation factor